MTTIELLKISAIRLSRARSFSLTVIATLSLGLGVSIAMFSLLYGVVIKGLGYPSGDRLVEVRANIAERGASNESLTWAQTLEAVATAPGFQAVGYYLWNGATLLGSDTPKTLSSAAVGGDFFKAVGLAPLLGRTLTPDDAKATDLRIVLGEKFWREQFAADPTIVGRSVRFKEGNAVVVGVMPAAMKIPAAMDFWQPITPSWIPDGAVYLNANFMANVALLAPGVSADQINTQLRTGNARLQQNYPGSMNAQLYARPYSERVLGKVKPVLWALFALSLLVTLISCANTANLLLARNFQRLGEFGVQQALGASAKLLQIQLLFDSLILRLWLIAVASGACRRRFAACQRDWFDASRAAVCSRVGRRRHPAERRSTRAQTEAAQYSEHGT
jgi:putative ABC transport system permease protein